MAIVKVEQPVFLMRSLKPEQLTAFFDKLTEYANALHENKKKEFLRNLKTWNRLNHHSILEYAYMVDHAAALALLMDKDTVCTPSYAPVPPKFASISHTNYFTHLEKNFLDIKSPLHNAVLKALHSRRRMKLPKALINIVLGYAVPFIGNLKEKPEEKTQKELGCVLISV